MNKQTRKQYRLKELAHCPKTPVLILHDSQSGRVFLQWVDKKSFQHSTGSDLVSVIEFSEFSPYICFLDHEQKIEISANIISLIGKITRLALNSPLDYGQTSFSRELKHEYLKAVRYFQSHFYNALYFVAKIRKMVVQLWKHAKIYRNFNITVSHRLLMTEYCN